MVTKDITPRVNELQVRKARQNPCAASRFSQAFGRWFESRCCYLKQFATSSWQALSSLPASLPV
jgi:hypothetical protein